MRFRKVFSMSAVLGCAFLAACTTTKSEVAFRPIGAEEARIVLQAPAFAEASRRHLVHEESRNGNRTELLVAWTETYRLEAVLHNAGPDHVWKTVKTDPREFLAEWRSFKDLDFDVERKQKVKTPIGFIDVWRVSSSSLRCATWNHYLDRRHGVDFYGGRFMGYFCRNALRGLSDEMVIRTMEGFGLRGSGRPLPAPLPTGTPT
ncbi:hypothetical protein [Arenibaculum sp.]|jgi:hypothetical protein|uniref:hypothetical protein n=1 Tax=Arenibaculum sp. TaxID=2865862 RepID=UPI002E14D08C|nr:hypothetical protein [Arenibaculum sp.]